MSYNNSQLNGANQNAEQKAYTTDTKSDVGRLTPMLQDETIPRSGNAGNMTPLQEQNHDQQNSLSESRQTGERSPRYTPSRGSEDRLDNSNIEFVLHKLCREHTVEEIYRYLQTHGHQPNIINEIDNYGFAPIHYVMRRDTEDLSEILHILQRFEVDTNVRSLQEGDTCLHIAAKRLGEMEAILVCLTLLEMGADNGYRNDKHRTAYDIALARNMTSLAEYLSADISGELARAELEKYREINYGPLLVKAVIDGDKKQIIQALKEGADPNFINKHGAASIHYTITHCSLEKLNILKLLVEAGADVNLQDYEGDTALNLVIKDTALRKYSEMQTLAQQLVDWGADHTLQDLDGKDAYRLAKEKDYSDILQILGSRSGKDPLSSQSSLRSNTLTPFDQPHSGQFTPNQPIENETENRQFSPRPPTTNKKTTYNGTAPPPSSLAMPKNNNNNNIPTTASIHNRRRSRIASRTQSQADEVTMSNIQNI